MDRTLVIGEALVDIVRRPDGSTTEFVGGSPLNVALGLARLGQSVDFATRYGDDERGHRITAHLASGGVHVLAGSTTADHTSTALAELDPAGAAAYTFDLMWDLRRVPVPVGTGHVHTGSIAAVLEPGGTAVVETLTAARPGATVSYDPNVRTAIMGDLDLARVRIEEVIALCDVVKASDEDLEALYAGMPVHEVLRHWGRLGPALTVVTRGADGVVFRVEHAGEVASAPTVATSVVDTVGAGDSFMAGLVSGLLSDGLLGGPQARRRLREATLADVRSAIERGLACSGLTVGRAGAYAPSLAEL
ncbi:carbohydrate kinase family protein [Lapillicoccus sp.]|uniref:carbohydrate kinase family protein n=1 Tax=Lapillicoccus sp. TaxID=1909287 RepID=UPI0039831AEF